MNRLPIILLLLFVSACHAKDPSTEVLAILRQSPRIALDAYKVYAEKYGDKTAVGAAAQSDSKELWATFSRYAKALWEVYDCIEVGDSVFKYPGLLSHGTIRWDDEKKEYWLSFGFRPFGPRDGLGAASISFDLSGKVLGKSKAKYPW
ncbi:MAG: hypothetical protein U1F71_15970 [Verrucomicrobiaceae bacterium]